MYNIHNNFFYGDFSNCARAISQVSVPGMNSLFLSWDATYDGISRFYGNILDSGRKYPMIETQNDTIGSKSLSYLLTRRSGRVWNNTMYRGGMGKGNQPYMVSIFDYYDVAYTNDTVEMHNNVEIGPPTDTTTGNFCYSTYCYNLLTEPNGTIAFYDTSGNQFSKTMVFGSPLNLRDTTTFMPIIGGVLTANGVSTPSWLTTDYYGVAIPSSNPSVGAVQYVPSGTIPSGYLILKRGRKIYWKKS